jgi:transmembrane sensor
MKRDPSPRSLAAIETAASRWIARREAGLSAVDEREFEAWLAADPRHREVFGFQEAAWRVLERPAVRGDAALLKAHLGKLAARRRRSRRIFVGTFAVACLAVVSVITLRRSPPAHAVAPPSVARVLTPERQTLPDGSIAELKESARIAVEFDATLRRVVLLAGEAHFAVQSDPATPFVVVAAGIEVRAVGTAFSVRRESAAVEVIVTHGTVALEQAAPTSTPAIPPLATLDAGMLALVELKVAPVPAIRAIAPAEMSQRLGWRGPRLEFTRTPLVEAVELFNRHAPADSPRLAVGDADVGTKRVSGIFRADNVEAFVSLLESAFDVRVERADGTVFLRSTP